MFEYLKTWVELKTDRRAVTMLEYAIMGSIIAGVVVIAVPLWATRYQHRVHASSAASITGG